MKTVAERKVNREVRHFNKVLEKDVFGKRFTVHQVRKSRSEGMTWFLYELIDNEQPERNYLIPGWLNEFDYMRRIWEEMNNFIVYSNFWSIYHNKPESYKKENDKYLR